MRRLWRLLVSLRLTAILLAVLAGFLLLNVALPQQATDGPGYARALRAGPIARLALVSLGLGDVASSPGFLATLALFFANLAAVLVDRTGATLRRLRFAPPTPAGVDALLAPAAAVRPRPVSLTVEVAVRLLHEVGYRAVTVGVDRVWGVKHRLALLGFPLFHASFFVLCAGAAQLYLTRDVTTLVAVEGQTVDSGAGHVVRRAPVGAPPARQLSVERVEVRLEDGKAVDLGCALAVDGGARGISRVNHPLVDGALTVLVQRAGLAPVLWVTDEAGYTLDRVAVPVLDQGGFPTRVPLGDGVEVVLEPIPVGRGFPERAALATARLPVRVRQGDRTVFEGGLRPGEDVAVGARRVRLQEVRYWAGLRLVSERGGGVLVLGFLLAVVGIVWRMVWYRREIAVALDGATLRVGGRGELYPSRARDELTDLAAVLAAGAPAAGGAAERDDAVAAGGAR